MSIFDSIAAKCFVIELFWIKTTFLELFCRQNNTEFEIHIYVHLLLICPSTFRSEEE